MYEQIYQTYQTRFHELDSEHQFHLATRLKLACNDKWAASQVESLKNSIISDNVLKDLAKLRNRRLNASEVNAPDLRMPLFAEHDWLIPYELMLFLVLHANIQFGIEASDEMRSLISVPSRDINALTRDPQTFAILSTYLVNTYYLHTRLVEKSTDVIPLKLIKEALAVSLDDPNEPRLKVYLLTHCILGETLFYARGIPEILHTYYESLARLLISQLNDTWHQLTIDAKLEAAYCLKLLSLGNDMIERALRDAEAGYSSSHGFIIDKSSVGKNNLITAEHRNVLYLMLTYRA